MRGDNKSARGLWLPHFAVARGYWIKVAEWLAEAFLLISWRNSVISSGTPIAWILFRGLLLDPRAAGLPSSPWIRRPRIYMNVSL